MGRLRVLAAASVLALALGAGGCFCATFCPPPLPGHVGVPDKRSRSDEYTLPLDPDQATTSLSPWLKAHAELLPSGGAAQDYAPVLRALEDKSLWKAGVGDTAQIDALVAASGQDWRMQVNDARADELAAWVDAFGVGAGDFVFVVYRDDSDTPAPSFRLVVVPRKFVMNRRA